MPSTCSWGLGWHGGLPPSTGRPKGGRSTWSLVRWPSLSHSSPSSPSCPWGFCCYAGGRLLAANWGVLGSPKFSPHCCFLDCGFCMCSCPAWRPTATCKASDDRQALLDQLKEEPVPHPNLASLIKKGTAQAGADSGPWVCQGLGSVQHGGQERRDL